LVSDRNSTLFVPYRYYEWPYLKESQKRAILWKKMSI
jgi:hypothetical protein